MTDFDPARHRMVSEQRWFEDFVLGERFVIRAGPRLRRYSPHSRPRAATPIRSITMSILPRPRHAGPARAWFPDPGPYRAGRRPVSVYRRGIAGWIPRQSSKFLKPVYAGDTIYPALEVIELVPGRTTGVVTLHSTVFNQRKELVLEGMQKFLVRRRPA